MTKIMKKLVYDDNKMHETTRNKQGLGQRPVIK